MPRKSTSSSTPGDDGGPEQSQSQQIHSQSPSDIVHLPESTGQMVEATEQQLKARAEGGVSIEDYLLPRSLTLRLAKSVLPPNTSIQKDAVLAIQKAATVFVSYLSSHANEATLKRTVAPSDVFSAISELEFDGFRTRLEQELEAFTELKAGKRRAKKGDSGTTAAAAAAEGVGKSGDAEEEEEDGDRGVKRVKRAEGEKKNGIGAGGEEEEGDETQEEHEQEQEQEDEEEEEEEEEEDDEEEEEEHKDDEDDDIDRVEDLDRARRPTNPDVEGDDSDSEDEDGPGSQLRGDLGLG
ncbi:transcriptional regulator family: Histone-like TF [Aspergillus niger]|uniref:DNA polymerase epsilon subunit D n=1 Tax=Aspergillus niger TaxID=5061 RepID=A0A9W6A706_ASPNG|nr:transcriptional regulator family: Histone-like TF [Aspergillus niger]KAI2852978.1 transcriptional regulator family: Histone-like TF [Aspergillus niger]KAI2916009.1 transcriptional regulator family: Histone-like TF [Aspergillus niger]KAI2929706.1 transcriptional regulator family: Histone-like TF [Aspergillus niger]KAI2929840.1 transcriptional regulator family: Histone-like TF [Aspergillus niger]